MKHLVNILIASVLLWAAPTTKAVVVLPVDRFPIDPAALIVDKDHPNAGNTLIANRGSAELPFRSIQHALCYMKTSGRRVLYVKPASTPYYEPYRRGGEDTAGITVALAGTESDPVIISGYPGMDMPVIDQRKSGLPIYNVSYDYVATDIEETTPRAVTGFLMSTTGDQAQWVTIRGFEIRNTTASGIMGNHAETSSHCTFEYNNIHHCYGLLALSPDNVGAIRLDNMEYAVVRENFLHNIYGERSTSNPFDSEPYGLHSGIHGYRPSCCQIYNNEIYVAEYGIYQKQPNLDRLPGHTIFRNFIHDTSTAAFEVGTMGRGMPSGNGNWFYENIVQNTWIGVIAITNDPSSDQPQHLYLYNNTFVGNAALLDMMNARNVEAYNNIYVNHTSGREIFAVDQRNDVDHPWTTFLTYFDYNLYDNPGHIRFEVRRYTPNVYTFTSLATWQSAWSGGKAADILAADPDTHSSTATPTFVDETGGNFHLATGSPGLRQGRSRDGLEIVNQGAYMHGTEHIGPCWDLTSGVLFTPSHPAGWAQAPDGGGVLTGTESTPPSTPTGLHAETTPPASVVLTWSPSTDDTAVSRYRIDRDGTPIGTSETPEFADTGLTFGATYSYTVTAFDVSGNISSASAPLSVVIHDETYTAFAAWVAGSFTAVEQADAAISGPNADPDGAGLTNFARFAFALPARCPVASPSSLTVSGTGNDQRLTLTFPRKGYAPGLSYVVQSSTDLVTWTDLQTVLPGYPKTISVTDPIVISTSARRFLRLRVLSSSMP